jgi:hypothetical protein
LILKEESDKHWLKLDVRFLRLHVFLFLLAFCFFIFVLGRLFYLLNSLFIISIFNNQASRKLINHDFLTQRQSNNEKKIQNEVRKRELISKKFTKIKRKKKKF